MRVSYMSVFLIFLFFCDVFCIYADDYKVEVTQIYASSTLPDTDNIPCTRYERRIRYSADKIMDGDPLTAWSEGVSGSGVGESITIVLSSVITVDAVEVMPGYFEERFYYKNNRVKTLGLISEDGSELLLNFTDIMQSQSRKLNKPIKFKTLKIRIEDVFRGDRWDDTCIAEIKFYLNGEAIELVYDKRISYKNGKYILPDFEEISIDDVNNSALHISLKADRTLGGGEGTGGLSGMEIINGTWSFDPENCSFLINYSYYTYSIIYDGKSERMQESEAKSMSCVLYVLEVHIFYHVMSDCGAR